MSEVERALALDYLQRLDVVMARLSDKAFDEKCSELAKGFGLEDYVSERDLKGKEEKTNGHF